MKKGLLALLVLFCLTGILKAQADAPVALMLAYQEKFDGVSHFSGTLRWQKQDGDIYAGSFVVDGENYHLTWADGELYGDGEYEWEVMHRSKRIKKRHYDPTIAPAVVTVFRFIRLDMTAEPVKIGNNEDDILIEVEYGSSVVQGNFEFKIDPNAVIPQMLKTGVVQEVYYEKTNLTDLKWGDKATNSVFTLDMDAWKKKGYSLTDMAKGDSDVIWPEERALR